MDRLLVESISFDGNSSNLITYQWGYAPVGEGGPPELYDLPVDPLAKHNIAADNLDIAAELHQLFTSHLVDHHAPDDFLALWQRSVDGRTGR